MDWRCIGDMLFETMMAELTDAYIRHWVSMS